MRPRFQRAIAYTSPLCWEHLAGRYARPIIDIFQQPALAQGAQIVAAPMLVKELPPPLRRIFGDMSDDGRGLVARGAMMPASSSRWLSLQATPRNVLREGTVSWQA